MSQFVSPSRTWRWLLVTLTFVLSPLAARAQDAPAKVTYDDHVRAIFRERLGPRFSH